jgi:hypothetical protein
MFNRATQDRTVIELACYDMEANTLHQRGMDEARIRTGLPSPPSPPAFAAVAVAVAGVRRRQPGDGGGGWAGESEDGRGGWICAECAGGGRATPADDDVSYVAE